MAKQSTIHRKKVRRRVNKKRARIVVDKYDLYRRAVQSAENDVEFIRDTYKELKKKSARTFREDFCGTFALSTEWIKLDPKHNSIGVDLDPEPMAYGKANYLSKIRPEQQKRMQLIEGNVLHSNLPKADVVAAMNFSYFCFKSREVMKLYFTNVYKSLAKDGVFLVDVFGGSQCQGPIEDTIKMDGFTYYWDQANFDPVSNEALFYIHFRVGGRKIEKVFTYDWRLWSIPELREIMMEAGFKKTHIYWEGTARDGSGNGVFTRTEKGESCDSWIAYVVAEK
ncbi:class I SAM-dependent methyltransferase [Bdellovibrio sp. HCB337]|uniref:class I SAM-dependent methyltransferase n=1 Tax=Bdellovibrio sp. HCB337 TaxID=3394358 RepID=UPI0039A5A612